MEKARCFVVETPLGKLEIYAKHDKSDCAEDYPGVYIDLCGVRSEQGVAADRCLWRLCI